MQGPGHGDQGPGNCLPVHGFVLAGGKSSRMGQDKALLHFHGRPMVEIAVEKLRGFCAAVSIAGGRAELERFAPVVPDGRVESGPVAGIEAGLRAATKEWVLFVPVDVPLVPQELLRTWASEVSAMERGEGGYLLCSASYLFTGYGARSVCQPSFCMIHRECLPVVSTLIERGVRRLEALLSELDSAMGAGTVWVRNAAAFAPGCSQDEIESAFSNINTRSELEIAEASASAE